MLFVTGGYCFICIFSH
uniref:Uncharacterized protein n=1 Tax=Anguilla anguilla TaxID=7936 RepID=A0A0E9V865_ANGAN